MHPFSVFVRLYGHTTKTRLKQFTAIGLICIFAMAQMARYLPYLECRAMNLVRPASQVCDCEKLADETTDNLPNPNHTPSHHPIRMDEFFEGSTEALFVIGNSRPVFILQNVPTYLKGFDQPAWHPPDLAGCH